MSQKKVIGRREIVSILDLELYDLDAKVDTGADSNSLHCDDIFIDDEKFVHFTLLDEIHPAYHGKKMKMPLYKLKKVKSSNGTVQLRASIKVDILFFGKKYKIHSFHHPPAFLFHNPVYIMKHSLCARSSVG